MRRFLPRSLAGQTIIVLLIGLTVSHILSMTIYTADRSEVLTMSGGRQIAHRVAAITRLLDETPEEWRARILQATNSPTLSVTVTPVSRLVEDEPHGFVSSFLRKHLARLIGTEDESRVVVQVIDIGDDPSLSVPEAFRHPGHGAMARMIHGQTRGQLLRASVRLKDGQWLNFATSVPAGESLWSTKAILSMLLMAVGVTLFSLWVIRRVTRPLRVFAAASERLGKDVAAAALAETGPSEVRQASRAFNEMQQRLRRLIENRTRMLAAISHDLRTPITLLRLRAEFVENQEEQTKMLGTLAEMEKMISSTLSFAREDTENEDSQTVDLGALVTSITDDMADMGEKVVCEADDNIVYICRPIALRRALNNVIENAVKYGRSVRVELHVAPDTIDVIVEDEGPGIPEDDIDKVFTPFYRVEASRNRETGGVGLGLSVAQTIINGHGGDITLVNRNPHGLRVIIALPR